MNIQCFMHNLYIGNLFRNPLMASEIPTQQYNSIKINMWCDYI